MMQQLSPFRRILSSLMIPHIKERITLYGYGYTGRFLQWYAEYYHGIKIDYIVSLDMTTGHGYEQEIFREGVFNIDFKDIGKSKIWMAVPLTEERRNFFKNCGYTNGDLVDFYSEIYGDDIYWENIDDNVFLNRKQGLRDIQFLEFLEWKYGCNFLSMVNNSNLKVAGGGGAAYRATTQKELFEILDRCHVVPSEEDYFFDFGCGKGAAIVSLLDYGFSHGGGVEYEPELYKILMDNLQRLEISKDCVECIQGDAGLLEKELDKYNWFYFWAPFNESVFERVLKHLGESIVRQKRQVTIIYSNPQCHRLFEESKSFRLVNQFTIPTRQRVVNVYQN